jgi:TRAP-type C4-dicarboxylate transport system permease small subunit
VPVALLVAAEIAVLLAGVVARYVFHHPLIWSDEVASILFLWLAMLGSAVAFQRGEHMRMTAVVGKLAPTRAPFSTCSPPRRRWPSCCSCCRTRGSTRWRRR